MAVEMPPRASLVPPWVICRIVILMFSPSSPRYTAAKLCPSRGPAGDTASWLTIPASALMHSSVCLRASEPKLGGIFFRGDGLRGRPPNLLPASDANGSPMSTTGGLSTKGDVQRGATGAHRGMAKAARHPSINRCERITLRRQRRQPLLRIEEPELTHICAAARRP
jgi:hypothetical protein